MPDSCSWHIISRVSDRSMSTYHGGGFDKRSGGEGRQRPQAIIASAISPWRHHQMQLLRCSNGWGWCRLAASRQDVQDDVRAMCPTGQSLRTRRLHRSKPVGEHRGEDIDHLAIAIRYALELG